MREKKLIGSLQGMLKDTVFLKFIGVFTLLYICLEAYFFYSEQTMVIADGLSGPIKLIIESPFDLMNRFLMPLLQIIGIPIFILSVLAYISYKYLGNSELSKVLKADVKAEGSSCSVDLDEGSKEKLYESLSMEFIKKLESKFPEYSIEEKNNRKLKHLEVYYLGVKERLYEEISSLGRRGNLNLVIGMVTTIFAVWVLATTVLSGDRNLSNSELATYYVPRLLLSLFVEFFSFFFLRLYKSGLSEIKYFQNELTNVEMKFLAIQGAMLMGKEETIDQVIRHLAVTERNFKLAKDESTVALEKFKVDQEGYHLAIEQLVGLVKSNSGSNK